MSMRRLIDEVYLPNALMVGVDYRLFWRLTPAKLRPFIEAHEKSRRERLDQENFMAWVSGIYVSHAIASVMGEGRRYPQEPIAMFEDEESREARARRDAEAFGAYAAMFNKIYGKGNEDDTNKQISEQDTSYNSELQGQLQPQP